MKFKHINLDDYKVDDNKEIEDENMKEGIEHIYNKCGGV